MPLVELTVEMKISVKEGSTCSNFFTSTCSIVQFGLWAVLFTGISAATTPIVAFVMAQQEGSAEQMTSREDVVASATNGEEVELSQALEAATNPSPTDRIT